MICSKSKEILKKKRSSGYLWSLRYNSNVSHVTDRWLYFYWQITATPHEFIMTMTLLIDRVSRIAQSWELRECRADLGEQAKQPTASDVTGKEQIVSKLMDCGAVERLVASEETCKYADITTVVWRRAVGVGTGGRCQLIDWQHVTPVDLNTRRTTYQTLALNTHNTHTHTHIHRSQWSSGSIPYCSA